MSATELATNAIVRAQVCIVGSGPAGLVVARRLIDAGVDVIVVESGSLEPDPQVQALSEVELSGHPLAEVAAARIRAVGGNSTAWVVKLADGSIGIRYAPLEPHDFEARPAVQYSGWPISYEQLAPYYERAQQTCHSGPFDYGPAAWKGTSAGPWALDPTVVESKVFQFGPRAAFAGDQVAALSSARRARLIYGATVVELISPDAQAPVAAARCRRLDGGEFKVEADVFVLAMGGLGNPHLLLASNGTRAAGLGNQSDNVGRYLQDHPLLDGGSLVFDDRRSWNSAGFYDLRLVEGHSRLGYLALSGQVISREGLGGLSATLFPRPSLRRSRSLALYKDLVEAVRINHFDRSDLRRVPRALLGLDYLAIAGYRKLRYRQSLYHGFGRGGWSTMPHLDRKFVRWEIVHQAEQSPDPSNRVTLTRRLDPVGMPVLDVHWRWSEEDSKRAGVGRRLIAQELRRGGIGEVELPDDDDLPGYGEAGGSAHHMGTTRMSATPARGVVDRDCRLHEVDNVYVAGSSVFTTSGYANPTLTIVALAERLGEHLLGQMTPR